MSTQEGAITPLHPDPTNSIVRPVTAAHAQLTSAPAVASTLSRPRVMDQSHAPLPTKPSTTMAVEPTPRVVSSPGTPAVQQPLLTPGCPPLPSPSTFHFPFSTAPPRHATVSAVNARPGLMERFTAPQLQYPRPTLPQTLSMHAVPPPRMSPLGGSAITGDAYTQRHGLPGGLGSRSASTPTAPATKAAQHQAPPPSKSYSSSFDSEEHSNSAPGNAIWYDGEATRRMEESDDIHKEITDLYNMTEATVHTHIVQSVRRWPQPRSPHGPWSREDSESPSPMRHARRSLHTVEDATEVSGSPSGMSLTLSEEIRHRMDMLREADKSDDDTSVDELLRETWQEQEILAGGRSQRYRSHIGAYPSSPSDYDSDPAVYARYGARSAGNDFTYAPAVKQKTPKKRKASAGRSSKKTLTTLEQLQKRRVGHSVHRKYNVLPLNMRVKIVGNARTDAAVIGKEGRIVSSNMGWHAIKLVDGTEVRLQTSGIKQLPGDGAGAAAAATQIDDVGGMYDDMSDGSDAEFTPDPSLLLSSRASAPASALKQPAKMRKQQPPSSVKTVSLSTLAIMEPSKKLALKPKPVKSTSVPPRSNSGRQSASGKRKGASDTFAQGTQVVVVGNKRTNAKLIGREAVVLEYKPTGWHTIQMNDTSEIANVQGNALQLCAPSTSGNTAPIVLTPPVTAHTLAAMTDADSKTSSGMPFVLLPPTSPASRVSTPAIAHAVQPDVVRMRTEELPEVGQPNWTPATQTPAAAGRSISASPATPSAVENDVGVAGDTTLQRRLSYGTPGQGQRGDDDSEATGAAMEMGRGQRMAFLSAHAPGSTDAGTVGTALGGAAAAEEPLSVDEEDLKRQMKTWKAVRELHIQGAGLQSAVASPNGSARRLAVPPPPSASKERSRKQKLPTSSSPMGPSPHEAQPAAAKPAAAKLAPNKLAPKRSPPKQNNKPAPKQLAPRPPAWAAVAPLAVPAAPQQQCPQHQCNRPSIASLSKEEFMQDLYAFWVEQGVHKSLKFEPNEAWVAPKLNGSALDVFGLYSGVCKRGGYDNHMGINWTGQIFKEMDNYTEDNRQTGVGSSLKRHYSKLLLAYERAHSSDMIEHPCTVCGRKDNPTDGEWICCGLCDGWVHFGCDHRYKGQSFRQFVQGHAEYSCEECVKSTKQQRRD